MDYCGEVGYGCSPVLEDARPDQRLYSEAFLVDNEPDQAKGADDQWYESSPAVPGVLYTTPSNRNEESSRGTDEQEHAEPIHASKLSQEGTCLIVELQEDGDEHAANADEWKVDPENPSPADALRKGATYDLLVNTFERSSSQLTKQRTSHCAD